MDQDIADRRLPHSFLRPAVALRIVLLMVFSSLVAGNVARAQQPSDTTVQAILNTYKRTSDWQPSSPDPSGITYWAAQDQLLIVDGEVDEMSNLFTNANIYVSNRGGDLVAAGSTLPWSSEPVGIAVHPQTQHVFITDDDKQMIFEIEIGPDQRLGTDDDTVRSISAAAYGNTDPEGIGFDDAGTMYLTNGIGAKIHSITPGANDIFDGVPPAGDDLETSWDTTELGQPDPEGVAYYGGLLYIVSNMHKPTIAEVTLDGKLQRTIRLANVTPNSPSDLTWAPASAGGHEDHLYLLARGVDNDQDPEENDGILYEIAIPDLPGRTTIRLPLIMAFRRR